MWPFVRLTIRQKTLDTQEYRAERLELQQNSIQGQQFLTRKYWLQNRFLQCSTDAHIHHEQHLSVGHDIKNFSSLSTGHGFLVQCRRDKPSCFLFLWFLFRRYLFQSRKFMTGVSLSTMTFTGGRDLSNHMRLSVWGEGEKASWEGDTRARQPTANSALMWRRRRGLNMGHIECSQLRRCQSDMGIPAFWASLFPKPQWYGHRSHITLAIWVMVTGDAHFPITLTRD